MKKTVRIIGVFLLIGVIFALSSASAFADSKGKVIYKNDYQTNTPDETMWYINPGTPEVTEEYGQKFLRCTPIKDGTKACRFNFGPNEAENVDLSFKIRARTDVTATDAYLGVFFRSAAIPATPLFAYQLRLNGTKSALVFMNNHYDTTTTTLAEDPNTVIKAGLWYNVQVSLRNERIVIFVNGEKVFDLEDDQYTSLGGFGVCGVKYIFDIDDVLLTQFTGKNLPEPVPNEPPIWVGKEGTDEEDEFADTGEERLNLFGAVGKAVDTAVHFVNPEDMSTEKYIALGLLGLIVLFVIAVIVFLILFLSSKKRLSKMNLNKGVNNL